MVNIPVICVDRMMVSERKLLQVYRASNVWVHAVVSNVFECHDTKRRSICKLRSESNKEMPHLHPCFCFSVKKGLSDDLKQFKAKWNDENLGFHVKPKGAICTNQNAFDATNSVFMTIVFIFISIRFNPKRWEKNLLNRSTFVSKMLKCRSVLVRSV